MNYETCIDLDYVTLEDCVELFKRKGVATIINDGHIVNFKGDNDER